MKKEITLKTKSKLIKETNIKSIFEEYISSRSYTHQILNESQVIYVDNNRINYISIARNLSYTEDVESYSNLTFSFDPEYEEIIIHDIKIFRDNKFIDKLENAKIDILRREDELNNLNYNGRETLSIILYDIRVGDLLSYSFSREGKNPVFKSYFGQIEYINSPWDTYKTHIVAIFDEDSHKDLDIRYFHQDEKLQKEIIDGYIYYELISDNLKELKVPNDAPNSYDPWSRILFSNTKSWEEINIWAMEIYDKEYPLDRPLAQFVEECKNHSDDLGRQIAYALFYVQEQIRYFSNSSNLGGITPLNPNKSMEMRFADCKNKVVILKSILDRLGAESYPVLVHSENGGLLLEQGANITAFNHMIILIIYRGEKYWFDTTITGQSGDIEYISQVDFGYALVLKEGEKSLQSMKPKEQKAHIQLNQTYDLSSRESTLKTTTIYSDFYADRMRRKSQGRKIYELQNNYISHFKKLYPHLKIDKDLKLKDDSVHNKITLIESYNLGDIWEYIDDGKYLQAYFECDELSSMLSVPDKGDRLAPFDMIYPSNLIEEREIILPFEFKDELTQVKEDNEFFFFEKKETLNHQKDRLTQKYSYSAKTNIIEAKNIPKYIKCTESIYTTYKVWHHDPYDESKERLLKSLPYNKQTIYIHNKQYYDLRDEESATFNIKTIYYGFKAHNMKREISINGLDTLKKNHLNYYKGFYKNIEFATDVKIEEDEDNNWISIEENYIIKDIWVYDKENNHHTVIFINDIISDTHISIDDSFNDDTLELKYPDYIKEDREIIFPFDIAKDNIENSTVDNDFYYFQENETIDKDTNTFKQSYIYQVKKKSVDRVDFDKYKEDEDSVYVSYVKYRKNPNKEHSIYDIIGVTVYTIIAGYVAFKFFSSFS